MFLKNMTPKYKLMLFCLAIPFFLLLICQKSFLPLSFLYLYVRFIVKRTKEKGKEY